MDANAEWNETKFKEFTDKNGLIDMITDIHSEEEPPPTYARGRKKIDYILGDDHIRRAVVRAGTLDLLDGVSPSDHTMQYIDVDERVLFGDDSFCPIQGYQREFRLYDVKRKEKYKEKLKEIYEHQKIKERVEDLAKRFEEKQWTHAEYDAFNRLDKEMMDAIRAAASRAGRINFGYQRSKDLCVAGAAIRLHKAILSCVRNHRDFSEKMEALAQTLGIKLPDREKITLKQALANVCEAWKAKRLIEIDDGERRAAWLEDIMTQRALEVGGDPAKMIKCMINAAKRKGMFKRLRAILKSAWSSLDYIEVPVEKWLLDVESNELFEFDNGIYIAHAKFEEDLYEQYGQIKIPPNTAKVVDVETSGDVIHVKNPDSTKLATWRRVTKPEEMEEWLLKRNKRHLQQMYIEQCPPIGQYL
eukprot:scaffold11188_cov43-Cyclotella_meneghiniana.AAC.2